MKDVPNYTPVLERQVLEFRALPRAANDCFNYAPLLPTLGGLSPASASGYWNRESLNKLPERVPHYRTLS